MRQFTDKVMQYSREQQLFRPGQAVCVGLSGGADSVALLRALLTLRAALDIRVSAVHVNHMLRGGEAEADEQFVRALCERQAVPLTVLRTDVAALAAARGRGVEEAGRAARQAAYAACAAGGADCIALAHHADDQAETFLLRAARGSSLAGLAAMRPRVQLRAAEAEHAAQAFTVVRPLLAVTRADIRAYLAALGQDWREDATNADGTFARNAVRAAVLPVLSARVNAQTARHLCAAAEDLAQADDLLRAEALRRAAAGGWLQQEGEAAAVRLHPAIAAQPDILQNYMLLRALELVCGARRDLGREQLRQLRALFAQPTGTRVDLPRGIAASRTYEGVRLAPRTGTAEQARGQRSDSDAALQRGRAGAAAGEMPGGTGGADRSPREVPVTGAGVCRFSGWQFTCRLLTPAEVSALREGKMAARAAAHTVYFDADQLPGPLVLRCRRPGDRMAVTASGGTRKLKSYLIDEKIPREARDSLPLLAAGGQILWVVGHRRSEAAKVMEGTRRVLKISAEKTL